MTAYLKKNQHITSCMSTLIQTQEKEMTYLVKKVQRQGNGYDWCVFAFEISLLYGQDPTTITCNVQQLRPHLRACMESLNFTLFPSTPSWNM